MFDFSKMGGMFEEMQKNASKFQEELANKSFTAKSGAGMISATVNGNGELTDLDIDDSLMEDKDSLQILLLSCINEAYKMAEDNKKAGAMSMMGGMPGFDGK